MKKIVKKILYTTCCAALLASGSQVAIAEDKTEDLKPISVILNGPVNAATMWFAVADELGYFADAGMKVTLKGGFGAYQSAQRLERLDEDKYDFAYGDINSNIEEVALYPETAGVGVYMVMTKSPSAIIVPADSKITHPKELEGLRVLHHDRDVGKETFEQLAAATGTDISKITFIETTGAFPRLFDQMDAGKGEAVVGYIPTTTSALEARGVIVKDRIKYIPFSDYLPNMYGSALIASQNMVNNHPDEVKAFVKALNDAVVFTNDNPDMAFALLLKRYPRWSFAMKAAERKRYYNTIINEMNAPEAVAKYGVGGVDLERLQRSIDDAYTARNLPVKPELKKVFDDSFLPPLEDRVKELQAK